MKITVSRARYRNLYVLAIIYKNIIVLMMLLQSVNSDWLMECGNCRCKWNSGKKTADCKNLTLQGVPLGLSTEVQVLDLSFNKIKKIEENAFAKTELENLHKLFARNCSMERIHPLSFKGLGILIELDISNNVIKQLPRDAFSYLIKVRSLVINNNLLETLDNGLIRNLKYLHKIELKDNRIVRVNTDVFQNVPYLSQIFLNGNQLSFLRKESFEKLKRLASLSLDSNPWNCTCELQVFRDFALKRNLYTPPTSCFYPIHLRGVLWNDEQSGAFACKPKIIYPSRGTSINTSKENVTLICRVHASPNTNIAWDYNKQIYNSINYQARVHITQLREESSNPESKEIGREILISRLTIVGAEKSDEGIYTCVAQNPGGKDEVQMSLLVQKHNAQDLLLHNNLIIVICLMVLGLLSASIFLAMVTCCIYKKFKNLNPRHHHHHHHHHHEGSHTSEDSLEHEKRCQAVNSTVVVTNTGDVGYLQHTHDTTITDVDQQLQEQQLHHKPQSHSKLKVLIGGDNKRSNKIPNGNGLIIDSRISSLTTDLSDKLKSKYDENNTKDSLHKPPLIQHEIAQSNCSTTTSTLPTTTSATAATIKLLSSSKDKSMTSKSASSHFGSNLIQKYPHKNLTLEHQIKENKLSEYHNDKSFGSKQLHHNTDYQPDLLPHKPTSQSIPLSDTTKSYNSNGSNYNTLNQSNLSYGDKVSQNSKLEEQQQMQQHETIYSNGSSNKTSLKINCNSNSNINNNCNNSNIKYQQKDANIYGQYRDQHMYQDQEQQQLVNQRMQYKHQTTSQKQKDQNNDIRYASITPKNKGIISNMVNEDDNAFKDYHHSQQQQQQNQHYSGKEISTSDYLYNTHQRKVSGCAADLGVTASAGIQLTTQLGGSIKALDTISKLGYLEMQSGSISATPSTTIQQANAPLTSTSSSSGMMMSNSLNNGFHPQQLDSTVGITNTHTLHKNKVIGSSSSDLTSNTGIVSNTGTGQKISSSSSSKLQKYQFNKISSYDDRPATQQPPTILSSLSSTSLRPNLHHKNYNEIDNNIVLEPGGHHSILRASTKIPTSTTTTTTTTIIDDKYYSFDNGDITMELKHQPQQQMREEILPHKQTTIVTTSPSLNFLTNYYPRRELL